MNSEIESELNQILMAAIQDDMARKPAEPPPSTTTQDVEILRCSGKWRFIFLDYLAKLIPSFSEFK